MRLFKRRIHEIEVQVGQPFIPHNVFIGPVIPNVLMRYSDLTSSEKLCLARLYQYAGRNGECFPSQNSLAEELDISTRQVKRIIDRLQSNGFIEVVHASGRDRLMHRTSRYRFLWNSIYEEALRADTQET